MIKKILFLILLIPLSVFANTNNILRINTGSEPQTIDPQLVSGIPGQTVAADLFEGLVANGPNGKIVPGIAKSWTISKDKKTYTFKLRHNLKWSDGSPITSHDFLYSARRLVNPKTASVYAFIANVIVGAKDIIAGKRPVSNLGVKALDDYTVQIKITWPAPYFLSILAKSPFMVTPQKVIEKYGDAWILPEHIVSNGAFVLKNWIPKGYATIIKNKYYWDRNNVKLDGVYYTFINDNSIVLKAYQSGAIDFSYNVSPININYFQKHYPKQIAINTYLGTYYYGLNVTDNSPLSMYTKKSIGKKRVIDENHLKIRRALNLAINRKLLVKYISKGGEKPAYDFLPTGIADYFPNKSSNPKYYALPAWSKIGMKQRIALAKKLLAEAGYSKSHPLTVTIKYNTDQLHKQIAIAIASMWKTNIGVNTKLHNEDWKVFLADRRSFKTEIFRGGWIGDYNDPLTFLAMFESNAGVNNTGFRNTKFDALLALSHKQANTLKRSDLLAQANQILNEKVTMIPLYYYTSKHMIKPYVKGFTTSLFDIHLSKYFYIER